MNREQSKKLILTHLNSRTPIMTQAVKEALQYNLEQVEKLEHQNKALMNRCKVFTQGQMCIFCGMRNECIENEKEVNE